SGAGAQQKKKKKSSNASSSVVVSTVKRVAPPPSSRPLATTQPSRPKGAGATNALPPQVRARIEAAREAERQKHNDAQAQAKAASRASSNASSSRSSSAKASTKKKAALDDFIDSDEEDIGSSNGSSSSKATRKTSSKAATPNSRRGTPSSSSTQTAYTYLGRSGVVQPYLVPRPPLRHLEDQAAPPSPLTIISSASLVTSSMTKRPRGWGPFFKDLPYDTADGPPRCTLQYPGSNASEEFILMVPRDSDEYDPISDLLRSVYVTVKYYLDGTQRAMFGELDELEMSSAAGHIWAGPIAAPGQTGLAVPPMSPSSGPSTPISSSPPRASQDGAPASSSNDVGAISILRSLTKSRNRRSGTLFLATVQRYNELLLTLRSSGALRTKIHSHITAQGIPEDIYLRIQDQAYARTVAPRVDELAGYRSFSDNVYGELTPKFMSEISQLCGLAPGKKVLDLGCGVGNLVVQAAMQCGCSSLGIEAMPVPAQLGVEQLHEARRRWEGCWELGDFVPGNNQMTTPAQEATTDATSSPPMARVWQGDFLEDLTLRSHLSSADLLIVNNYAFTPPLNQSLSLLFLDLKDGAQIVSLKPFVPADFRLNERTLGSSSAILRVEERDYGRGMVSWTERGGKYYIATVDRTALRSFLEGGGGA
ncbi:S-adenosyl-L-methionine-dependent methyltransferase, partial [Jaminaea rosea]